MSEKAKLDERALCRFMGRLMFALAACFLVIAASDAFCKTVLLWIGLILFFSVIIAAVIYANTGNRFRK